MRTSDWSRERRLEFGCRLATRRKALGFTREQLARRVGDHLKQLHENEHVARQTISASAIGRYERGEVTPNVEFQLALSMALRLELRSDATLLHAHSTDGASRWPPFHTIPVDVFSLVTGRGVCDTTWQEEGQRLFHGFYVLTRRHSQHQYLCRELLYIGQHDQHGIHCKLVTYKRAIYSGLAYWNHGLLYFIFARPQKLYRYAARFLIARTSLDGEGDLFHALFLRITTSTGHPMAAECTMERIKSFQIRELEELRHTVESTDGNVPDGHWLTNGHPAWIGTVAAGECRELHGHNKLLANVLLGNTTSEIRDRMRNALATTV